MRYSYFCITFSIKLTHIMMKNYITFFLIFIATSLFAQTSPFSQSISQPKGIVEYNGFLYVAASADGKIVKLNLGATPEVMPVDVITGLTRPFGIALNGSELYIVDAGSNSAADPGKILKVDLANSIPQSTLTNVYEFTPTRNPRGILIDQNKLYVTELVDNVIYTGDISGTPTFPLSLNLFSNLNSEGAGPVGMVVKNNIMYVAGRDSNFIYNINDIDTFDGTTELVANNYINLSSLTGTWQGPDFLYIDGDFLYVSDRDEGNVGRVDVSLTNPLPSGLIVTNAISPEGIIVLSDKLYISENSRVTSYDVSLLSVNDNNGAISNPLSFKVFPNPTENYIRISGVKNEQNFKIYNLLGRLVKKGKIYNDDQIDISSFDNGMYLLKLDSGNVIKVIKE